MKMMKDFLFILAVVLLLKGRVAETQVVEIDWTGEDGTKTAGEGGETLDKEEIRTGCDPCTGVECEWVEAHNKFRAMVDPPAADMSKMCWSQKLAQVALGHAQECRLQHNADRTSQFTSLGGMTDQTGQVLVGENVGATQARISPIDLIKLTWFEEGSRYNHTEGSCRTICGHYTQLVWANSYMVGCAIVHCPTVAGFPFPNTFVYVCNYAPGGNILGQKPYVAA